MEVIIYHRDCSDGIASAAIASEYFIQKNMEYRLWGYRHGDVILPAANYNDNVWLLDVYNDNREFIDILKTARRVVVIDHHVGSDVFAKKNGFECFYDINHSASRLVWDYFFGDLVLPIIINYIEDRDLWRFQLEKSPEINAYLKVYVRHPEAMRGLLTSDLDIDKLAADGGIIKDTWQALIYEMQNTVRRHLVAGYNVPVVNAGVLISDLLHRLCAGEPFAVAYYRKYDNWHFELRSDDNGLDVGKIARRFGGGGHRHASGFILKAEKAGDILQKLC